jgi:hypothetical protein
MRFSIDNNSLNLDCLSPADSFILNASFKTYTYVYIYIYIYTYIYSYIYLLILSY